MHKKLVHTFTRAATPSMPRFCPSFRLSAASCCFCKASFRRLLAAAACKRVYTKSDMALNIYWLKTWSVQIATSNHILQTFGNQSGVCSRYWLPTSSALRRRTLACFWKSRSSLSRSYCLLRSCRNISDGKLRVTFIPVASFTLIETEEMHYRTISVRASWQWFHWSLQA